MKKRSLQNKYNFVIADSGPIMPAPSDVPYQIAFITPVEYESFQQSLDSEDRNMTINTMYKMLAMKVPLFSFDQGNLVLPRNYANCRL